MDFYYDDDGSKCGEDGLFLYRRVSVNRMIFVSILRVVRVRFGEQCGQRNDTVGKQLRGVPFDCRDPEPFSDYETCRRIYVFS